MFILSKELGLGLLRKHKLTLTVRPEEPIGRKETLQVVKAISPWDLLQAVEKAIGGNGKDVEVSLDKRNKEPDCVRLFAETTNEQTVTRISDKLSGLSLKLKGTPGRLVLAVEVGKDQSANQKRPWETSFGNKPFGSLPPGQRADTVRIDGLPRAWFRRKRLEGEPEPSVWDVERDVDASLLGKVFAIFGDVTFVDVYDDDQAEKAASQLEKGGGGGAKGAKVGIVFSACVQYKESAGFSKAMDKLWGDIKTILVRTGGPGDGDSGRGGEAAISVDFERTGYMSNFSRRERRFAREQRRLKDIVREKKRKEEEERRQREKEREERERREREEAEATAERERLEEEERERQAEIERLERERREKEEREEAARRELEEFLERQKREREEEERRERDRLEKERLEREAEAARKAEAGRLLRERLEEERRETERREGKLRAVREERLTSLRAAKNRMQRHVLGQLLEAAGKEVGEKVREREGVLRKRQREEEERGRREGGEREVRVLHRRVEVLARRREILLERIEAAKRDAKRQRVDG